MPGIKGMLILSLLAVAAAVGCDQSKAELDSTKTQLTAVTGERDGLKTQLTAAQQQVTALQAQVAQLQAAATKPAEPAVAAAPVAEEKGKKHKAAKAEPAPATTPTPAPTPPGTTGPASEARKGRGHF
jgi:hypothetical protein